MAEHFFFYPLIVKSIFVTPSSRRVSRRDSEHKSPLCSCDTVCSSSFSSSVLILITSPNTVPDPPSSCMLSLGSHLFVHPLDAFQRNKHFPPSVPPLCFDSRKTALAFTTLSRIKEEAVLAEGLSACDLHTVKDLCLINIFFTLFLVLTVIQLYLRYEV